MYSDDLSVLFSIIALAFGIFILALLVRLWIVLGVIHDTCRILQRIAKEKYPEETSNVQQPKEPNNSDVFDHLP
ncbi:hypothetical protein C6503_03435 [Candidatus Poribacteria bacterium]|nr:MAG: hypothetical protein C6503_03435 [Candidatus Poribacteria bacterium]